VAIGVFSKGVRNIPHVAVFLGAPVVSASHARFRVPIDRVAGWGLRPTSTRARRYAHRHGLPYIALEDGFLRSVGLGTQDPPLSLVVDDRGFYYDATRPSRLECSIARPHSEEEMERARRLAALWRATRVSKYNHLREYGGDVPARAVLVVDQTVGDASIHHGLAGQESFDCMLQTALSENPDCTVLVKVHPDVWAGRKKGYFDVAKLGHLPRVQVLGQDVHPVSLLEQAESIYVVTSQLGFEGLLWGKPVRTFGMPFYAGWGLTKDELSAPAPRKPVVLESLVHAALVDYPRYLDPETGQRCEPERLIEWLALQRRMRTRFPQTVYAAGFPYVKRRIVRQYFQGSALRFVRTCDQAPEEATVAVWGRGVPNGKRPVIRLEDAFVRSVGLGADLIRPLSLVMDAEGLYYDATVPSGLERLLGTTQFPADLLARARRLRERLVGEGLTKYNVGAADWRRPMGAGRVILVPGQVESDVSIRYGAPAIKTNMGLLQAVREGHPGAHVIYKPHPDVVAGLRKKGSQEDQAMRWCDEVVTEVAMGKLLSDVDEVHVLTSLAGFEALLRGKAVTCYGQPFYAGWGLTEDRVPIGRRTRRLTLDALVAGALIVYPTYVSRTTGRFTTPERALDELLDWRRQEQGVLPVRRRLLRLILRLWKRF
jgi:capsular polysaccharide export protein